MTAPPLPQQIRAKHMAEANKGLSEYPEKQRTGSRQYTRQLETVLPGLAFRLL